MRRVFLGLALLLAASCAHAQTAPSPADVGISKGNPDVFKLKGSDNAWTPFGSVDPSTHIFVPPTNGNIAPGDCIKWGPGLTSAGAACGSGGGGGGAGPLTIYTSHDGLVNNVTTPAEAWTVQQQGFYAPGDGGAATYQWNFASYCADGTSGAPVAADGLGCILPTGQPPSTAGRYLLQMSNSLDVRQIGMQPGGYGGFDNSPRVAPLMAFMNNIPSETGGMTVEFPAIPGQVHTDYYFTKAFHVSRGMNITCPGTPRLDGTVRLLFADGVHGLVYDSGSTSFDGFFASGSVNGCMLMDASRYGSGAITSGSATIPGVGLALGWPVPGASFQLAAGDGVIVYPVYEPPNGAPAVAGGAYLASADAVAKTIVLASPYTTNISEGGGLIWRLPASQQFTINTLNGDPNFMVTGGPGNLLVAGDYVWTDTYPFGSSVMGTHAASLFTQTSTNNFVVGDTIQVGSDTHKFVSSLIGAPAGSILVGSNFANSADRFASAANNGLQGGIFPGSISGTALTVSYYEYGTLLHAGQQIAGAAPGTFVVGGSGLNWTVSPSQTLALTELTSSWYAASYTGSISGTTLSISAVASGTVAIGQYVIGAAPGTVITGGSGASWTVNTSQTLASTSLNSGWYVPIAAAPTVNAYTNEFPASATTISVVASDASPQRQNYVSIYTPAGVAAGSFQAGTFTDAIGQMGSYTGLNGSTFINASKTETGAKLWIVPAGLKALSGVQTHNNYFFTFPFGLEMACGGIDPATGCNGSLAQENVFSQSIIGRLSVGDNAGASTSISNVYSYNSLTDIAELGSVGSVYLGDNSNSAEAASSSFGVVGLCAGSSGGENFTSYIGMYAASNTSTTGYCLLGFNGEGAIPGGTNLWLGSLAAAPPGSPQIANSNITGPWSFSGPAGATCVNHPDFIIGFVAGGDCTYAWSFDGAEGNGVYAWKWAVGTGGIGGQTMWWTTGAYGGYTGYLAGNLAFVDFHQGFLLYDTESNSVTPGLERLVDGGATIPSGTFHQNGDVHFNHSAAPGGFGAWIDTGAGASFRPMAPVADDAAGTQWTLGNYMTLTPVALASLPATCAAGTFAVINNGVAAPVYNAAVGSTTGAATDPVFCTNGNVWKYH